MSNPFRVTAEDSTIRVDYRSAGKTYLGQVPESGSPEDGADRSDFSFDSTTLSPGQSIIFGEGDKLIRVVKLGG